MGDRTDRMVSVKTPAIFKHLVTRVWTCRQQLQRYRGKTRFLCRHPPATSLPPPLCTPRFLPRRTHPFSCQSHGHAPTHPGHCCVQTLKRSARGKLSEPSCCLETVLLLLSNQYKTTEHLLNLSCGCYVKDNYMLYGHL